MRNILVLNNEELLGAAIASLLQAEEDLELFGFTPTSSADLINTLHKSLRLDVLILDSSMIATNDLREFLAQLSTRLGTCVIVVDTTANLININNIYDISISQPQDLVEIVRCDLSRLMTEVREKMLDTPVQVKDHSASKVADFHKSQQPKHRRPQNPIRYCNHRTHNLT